jgi:hypothetical protein
MNKKHIFNMNNRTDKIKILDSIFNEGNRYSLQSLSRPIYPSVLIFQNVADGLLFSGRLNPTIPARYQDKVMDDKDLDTMLLTGGNITTFLLPDNFRD